MRNLLKKLTASLVLATFGLSAVTSASALPSSTPAATKLVCNTAPHVFFMNGIMAADADQIGAQAVLLRMELEDAGQTVQDVTPIYNPSEGAVLDIARKLASQKVGEAVGDLTGFLETALNFLQGLVSSMPSADQQTAQQQLAADVASSVSNFGDSDAAVTLDKGTEDVVSAASDGSKIILVAHSEGNMFAQAVYQRTQMAVPNRYNLTGHDISKQVQVVNVATPAAAADTGLYLTSKQDLVIELGAQILSAALPARQPLLENWDTGPGTQAFDFLGHAFVGVYLNDRLNGVETQIMSLFKTAVSQAVETGSDSTDGPMHLVGNSGFGTATFQVQAADGTMSALIPVSPGQLGVTLYQPSCSDLKVGTYRVFTTVMSAAGSGNGGPVQYVDIGASVADSSQPGGSLPMAVFQYFYTGAVNGPVYTQVLNVMDIVVSKSDAGGFKLDFYPYKPQQPQ